MLRISCTHSTLFATAVVASINVRVWCNSILITGAWISPSFALFNGTQRISVTTMGSGTFYYFLVQFSYAPKLVSYIADARQSRYAASEFLAMSFTPLRQHFWTAYARSRVIDGTSNARQEVGVVMLDRKTLQPIALAAVQFSFARQSGDYAVQYDPLSNQLGTVHGITTDAIGDILLLGSVPGRVLGDTLTVCQALPSNFTATPPQVPSLCTGPRASIPVNDSTPYYLAKFSPDGTPLFFKWLELGEYDLQLSSLHYDDRTGDAYMVSRLHEEGGDGFRGTGVLRVRAPECGDSSCSGNGWCLIEQQGVGACQCSGGTFGSRCEISLRRSFESNLVWHKEVAISRLEPSLTVPDEVFVQLGIASHLEHNAVYACGYISGTPHGLHSGAVQQWDRTAWISRRSDATGALVWLASVQVLPLNDTGSEPLPVAIAYSLQVDPFSGEVYVSGWADAGSLEARSTATNDEAATTVPWNRNLGVGPWAGKLSSDGRWEWIQRISMIDSCGAFSSQLLPECAAPTKTVDWEAVMTRWCDIALLAKTPEGGRDLFATGSFFSKRGVLDAFVVRLNFHNARPATAPVQAWTKVISGTPGAPGRRGGRSITVSKHGDAIFAMGYWTSGTLETLQPTRVVIASTTVSEWVVLSFRLGFEFTNGALSFIKTNAPSSSGVSVVTAQQVFGASIDTSDASWSMLNTREFSRSPSGAYDRLRSSSATAMSFQIGNGLESYREATLRSLSTPEVAFDTTDAVEQWQNQLRDAAWNPLAWDSWFIEVEVASSASVLTAAGFVREASSVSHSLKELVVVPKHAQMRDLYGQQRRTPVVVRWSRTGEILSVIEDWQRGDGFITAMHEDSLGNLYIAVYLAPGASFGNLTASSQTSVMLKLTECEAECNRNGYCVPSTHGFVGSCSCFDGWSGPTCATPHCAEDCYGRGECVAPNTCVCQRGWAAPLCRQCDTGFAPPYCTSCQRGFIAPDCQNCSARFLPPTCSTCRDGWQPPDCEECNPGFKMPGCRECRDGFEPPHCQFCKQGFRPPLCTICREHFGPPGVCDRCDPPGLQWPDCERCRPGFAPPACARCLPHFAEPDCDRCEYGRAGANCTDCAEGFAPPACTSCLPGRMLPDCKQCHRGFLPPDCTQCRVGM